jgi:hypothetical protein
MPVCCNGRKRYSYRICSPYDTHPPSCRHCRPRRMCVTFTSHVIVCTPQHHRHLHDLVYHIIFTLIKRYMEKKELVNIFFNKVHIIEKLARLVGFQTCRRGTLPYLLTLSFSCKNKITDRRSRPPRRPVWRLGRNDSAAGSCVAAGSCLRPLSPLIPRPPSGWQGERGPSF